MRFLTDNWEHILFGQWMFWFGWLSYVAVSKAQKWGRQ